MVGVRVWIIVSVRRTMSVVSCIRDVEGRAPDEIRPRDLQLTTNTWFDLV